MAQPPVKISELPPATALSDADIAGVVQQDGPTRVLRSYTLAQMRAHLGLAAILARLDALEAGGSGGGGSPSTFPMTFPITLA